MQHDIHLLLGSNRGNRLTILHHARELIELHIGKICRSSSIYETEPWGFSDNTLFLNQVLCVRTELNPFLVLEKILRIETEMGRTRQGKGYSGRIIDIDILLYESLVVENEYLVIPHPRLHLRRFTLEPLTEISENLMHPVLGKTMVELMASCTDPSEVHRYEPKVFCENHHGL